MRLTHGRGRLAIALMLIAAVACNDDPTAGTQPLVDDPRTRVIAAIPPEVAERGVFVYDPAAAQDLFPGTFTGPDLAILLADAEWVAESAVPPLVVASGVGRGQELPPGVMFVNGLLVAAVEPADAEQAAARIREASSATGVLADLVAASAPLSWAGPASRASTEAGDLGDALIHVGGPTIDITVQALDPEGATAAIEQALATGGVPSSPGRRWSDLLVNPEVAADGDRVTIQAEVGDLPALLLRQLIDAGSLTFLTSG